MSIDARLQCDEFATSHSSTSHYDKQSFVGLAWRPTGECICCGALFCLDLLNSPLVKKTTHECLVCVQQQQKSILQARQIYQDRRESATCLDRSHA